LDEQEGLMPNNVWADIPNLNAMARERTGYPTQKPQALARRIIEASSNPGDLVLDCFAGCAYVPVAAELAGRRWTACDMSPRAWTVVRRQFHKQPDLRIVTEGEYTDPDGLQRDLGDDRIIRVRGPHELPQRTTSDEQKPLGIRIKPDIQFLQTPVENGQQIWDAFVDEWGTACWYCGMPKQRDRRELHLDHIEPNKKDGSNDDCWNRALACAPCNSDKSNGLTPKETIGKALKEGRIEVERLRGEQEMRFQERHEWAKERWEKIKPRTLL
jgi:5-methylcytosine-specific restriction endonuclease McrA